ncbi:uncharacterized protein LOC110115721, partial [Dendrobium catenatum]|uniref:uncharacterized protein LOC110115721 n=1 Tax=Dendrobium catenatum TaxID=906689 RepID=UPI00109F77B1
MVVNCQMPGIVPNSKQVFRKKKPEVLIPPHEEFNESLIKDHAAKIRGIFDQVVQDQQMMKVNSVQIVSVEKKNSVQSSDIAMKNDNSFNILASLWKIKEVKVLQYLGVKMTLRRLKHYDFLYLLDKVLSKLDLWGRKYISSQGKLALIKSVVLSVPGFFSTHTLIPLSILKELDRLCRDYLWRKDDFNPGLHYVAWEDLCKTICVGGRGVHSVVQSVGPLRAKFTWNFFKKLDSLLNKTLREKYGSDVMHVDVKRFNSPTWKILICGAKSLQPVIRFKIVAGNSIIILKDCWIWDRRLELWPTCIATVEGEFPKLENFILNGSWNKVEFLKFFGKEMVDIILQIKLYPEHPDDEMELVKSFSGKTIVVLARSYADDNLDSWSWFKKMKLIPRVALFWWHLWRNAIPSIDFLVYRKLANDNLCPRGCDAVENSENLAIKCGKMKEAIGSANRWGFSVPMFNSWTDFLLKLKYMLKTIVKFWASPPPEWIKVNIDATLLRSNETRIGGVFRDHKGRFLLTFGIKCTHWDNGALELLAFQNLNKVIKDWMMDSKWIILESDSYNVVNYLKAAVKKPFPIHDA